MTLFIGFRIHAYRICKYMLQYNEIAVVDSKASTNYVLIRVLKEITSEEFLDLLIVISKHLLIT